MCLFKWPSNRNYEFDAQLEDHPVGNQDIYRLHYIHYHRIQEYDGCRDNNVGVIDWRCKPFKMPIGMTREEGFRVLSYLTDFIEKRPEIEPCSWKSVKTLDSVLNLERFGFVRTDEKNENKILDLYTVGGRILLFKKSAYYPYYFEWYTPNVPVAEVRSIYARSRMDFRDIEWLD